MFAEPELRFRAATKQLLRVKSKDAYGPFDCSVCRTQLVTVRREARFVGGVITDDRSHASRSIWKMFSTVACL